MKINYVFIINEEKAKQRQMIFFKINRLKLIVVNIK